MKFTVGQRVRVVAVSEEDSDLKEDYEKVFINQMGEIIDIFDAEDYPYEVKFDDEEIETFSFREDELEGV